MTEFQVGDRVSVEGVVTQGLDTGAYVKIDYPQPIHHFFPTDALTLVERPRRKLRVGSVWQVGEYGPRYTYLGEDLFGATTRQKVHKRSSLSFDTEPEVWREVPVEELEREAQ